MKKFVAGQIVRLKDRPQDLVDYSSFYGSYHILSHHEVKRGYYLVNGQVFNLGDCVAIDRYIPCLSNRCQTLKGKRTQPISFIKYADIALSLLGKRVSCYVRFKGIKQRIDGIYFKGLLYFVGMNSSMYKTKVFVTTDGYLCGLEVTLSDKQKLRSTKVSYE